MNLLKRVLTSKESIRPDIVFTVAILGRYQSKKTISSLQGTKACMLTYKHLDDLKVVGYLD